MQAHLIVYLNGFWKQDYIIPVSLWLQFYSVF